jgi:hypothetical protein
MAKRNKGNVKEQKRRYRLKYRDAINAKILARERKKGRPARATRTGCIVLGCDGKHRALGYCEKHYQRFRTYGDPLFVPPPLPGAEERFWAKVDKDCGGSCWLWTAAQDYHGYGSFLVNGRRGGAHRFAFELFNGPISAGMTIHHKCHNRLCVNPEHLEALTRSEHQSHHLEARRQIIKEASRLRAQNLLLLRAWI